jgi:phosphomannomutase
MNFVFDVDGTLTPSRGTIDSEFAVWFLDWTKRNNVYLATGSDYAKTLEQLGQDICESVKAVYNCAGNAVYVKGQLVKQSNFAITDEQRAYLESLLANSGFDLRTGQHIEDRIGLCNFSIVGRGANSIQRTKYIYWDEATEERKELAELINSKYPDLEATVAGETGLDIYQRGKDKSQIAEDVAPFVFFGDKIIPGGNDYTIAQKSTKYFSVSNWQDTFRILKEEYNESDSLQERL